MPVESPPAPASQAILAYALHHPERRQFVAAAGHYRVTGVLAQARLWRSEKAAQEARHHAPGDTQKEALEWKVVPVATDLAGTAEE